MKRREFLTLVGGAAMAWPASARAQQQVPVIGFLSSFSRNARYFAAFEQGLKELGYVAGQSAKIESRYAEGRYDALPALAADLVRSGVATIVATGGNAPGLAAKAATNTIPIVFVSGGGDPVKAGLVTSFNRPGANVTGISVMTTALLAKRLQLLQQLVPKAKLIGVLANPDYPDADFQIRELQEAARSANLALTTADARSERDFDDAFAAFAQRKVGALFTANDPFFNGTRDRIIALAARYAMPASYSSRDFPAAGGLMSYGPDFADAYRQGGTYVGRILKGERPSDLPVAQASKFELILNLKTSQALGLEVPPQLLGLADEVIE
jgi:putative ABC transport system substrate-binding protein